MLKSPPSTGNQTTGLAGHCRTQMFVLSGQDRVDRLSGTDTPSASPGGEKQLPSTMITATVLSCSLADSPPAHLLQSQKPSQEEARDFLSFPL